MPGPRPAADLGGYLHVLWRKAVAALGGQASSLRMRAVRGDVAGEAGGGPGGWKEVGGVPPKAGWALICVPLGRLGPRGRSPPCPAPVKAALTERRVTATSIS